MNILYAHEECENIKDYYSIFLCGPTPRSNDVKSWRPDLINELNKYNDFDLFEKILLLSPECRNNIWLDNYDSQIEWEQKYLELADLLVFWVPRELKHMPAFTTNIEFGMYIKSNKNILYGRPDNSPKNKYLDYSYNLFKSKKSINNIENMALEINSLILKQS